jgi:Tfp pilus assembly protein PilO
VKANAGRLIKAIERLLPFLLVVGIMACGYVWFIQPRLSEYLGTRADVTALDDRVRTLQHSTDRARLLPPADMQASLRELEKQMSREDKVADVAAALAQAVLESAPPDNLRGFVIETGNRIQQSAGAPAWNAPRVSPETSDDGPDPRMSLFPVAVSYTPVRITFESTFEAIANFLWKIRDLSTTVEIRSVTMARGLPLMKMDVLIWVFQRADVIDAGQTVPPGEKAPSPGGPTAPRVAQLTRLER